MELCKIDNNAIHVVNGNVVMVVENAINPETNSPLMEGQIHIQSEVAECYCKDMVLTAITNFLKDIMEQVKFNVNGF